MMKHSQTSQHRFIIGVVRLREVEQFVFDLTASSWERRANPMALDSISIHIKFLCMCEFFVEFIFVFGGFFWSF